MARCRTDFLQALANNNALYKNFFSCRGCGINIHKKTNREFYGWFKLKTERMRFELTVGV